jgi:4-hydroxy-tetrahydrodipicolinate synthase
MLIMDQEYNRFTGVFSLLLTPYLSNLSIDWDTYKQYVDWQLSHNPHGLFAVCGSSEMKWLTADERLALAEIAVKQAGTKPVLVTANLDPEPANHISEIRRMTETGISGIVLIPPDGIGGNASQLSEYLARIADKSELPIFLYEWPQVKHKFIDPLIYSDLVQRSGILGIKDTTCTMEGIQEKINIAPNGIVYQANTPFMLESIQKGAKGIMAITSASAASWVIDFWKQAIRGEEEAKASHAKLVFLDAILRMGYPLTAKYLANLQGMSFQLNSRWPVEIKPEACQAIRVWYDYHKADV